MQAPAQGVQVRWLIGGAVLLGLVVLWALLSPSPEPSPHVRTGTSAAPGSAVATEPVSSTRDAITHRNQTPSIPEGSRARVKIGPPVAPPAGWTEQERFMAAKNQREFQAAWDAFTAAAELTPEQTQAVLVVLYDFQEAANAAWQAHLDGYEMLLERGEAGEYSDFFTAANNEAYSAALEGLREILGDDQMSLFEYIAGHQHDVFLLLWFGKPIVTEK